MDVFDKNPPDLVQWICQNKYKDWTDPKYIYFAMKLLPIRNIKEFPMLICSNSEHVPRLGAVCLRTYEDYQHLRHLLKFYIKMKSLPRVPEMPHTDEWEERVWRIRTFLRWAGSLVEILTLQPVRFFIYTKMPLAVIARFFYKAKEKVCILEHKVELTKWPNMPTNMQQYEREYMDKPITYREAFQHSWLARHVDMPVDPLEDGIPPPDDNYDPMTEGRQDVFTIPSTRCCGKTVYRWDAPVDNPNIYNAKVKYYSHEDVHRIQLLQSFSIPPRIENKVESYPFWQQGYCREGPKCRLALTNESALLEEAKFVHYCIFEEAPSKFSSDQNRRTDVPKMPWLVCKKILMRHENLKRQQKEVTDVPRGLKVFSKPKPSDMTLARRHLVRRRMQELRIMPRVIPESQTRPRLTPIVEAENEDLDAIGVLEVTEFNLSSSDSNHDSSFESVKSHHSNSSFKSVQE